MIASVDFRNFKALRSTRVSLTPFNVLIGPNGSGKTSLIQSLLRLRTLAKLAGPEAARTTSSQADGLPSPHPADGSPKPAGEDGPQIFYRFFPPHQDTLVELSCVSELVCDTVRVESATPETWPALQHEVARIRAFLFDHYAMALPARVSDGAELTSNAGNLAAVLARIAQDQPAQFSALQAEFCRMLPEYRSLEIIPQPGVSAEVGVGARLLDGGDLVTADNLSQGTLYVLAMLALAFEPSPPSVVCLEEIDRGIHPRMLRELRDTLYRLSHPASFGLSRAPVQVIVTTHSPYLLDLFRDHPEEIVIAQKQGNAAVFERLSERLDLAEVIRDGPLGDLWFSGILGGVPEEKPRP